jgi:transketolase
MSHADGPTALVLSRQKLPFIDRTQYAAASGVARGAYVLADPESGPAQVVLIASGSEVGLILDAQKQLATAGIKSRTVSVPSLEIFARQGAEYQASVLIPKVPRVAIEAAHPMSWYRWVGADGIVIGLERFGASAPGARVMQELGITVDRVVQAAKSLLNR